MPSCSPQRAPFPIKPWACGSCQCSQWLHCILPYSSANNNTQNYHDGGKGRNEVYYRFRLSSLSWSLTVFHWSFELTASDFSRKWLGTRSLSLGSRSYSQTRCISSHPHKVDAEWERSAQSPSHPKEDLKVAYIAVPPALNLLSPFAPLVTGSQWGIPLAIRSQDPPTSEEPPSTKLPT